MTGRDPSAAKASPAEQPERPTNRQQEWITNQLRHVYDEALQEEIPADMLALLAKLDDKPSEEGGA